MNILELGNAIMVEDIMFEENQIDIKDGHPGIVLIPTDEYDEYTYCVHATSDINRYRDYEKKYFVYDKLKKTSYINLGHIIKVHNRHKQVLRHLNDDEISGILTRIKQYQIENGETEEYREISRKIEIILEILQERKNNPKIGITAERLRILEKLDIEWRKIIYYKEECREKKELAVMYNRVQRVKEKIKSYISRDSKGNNIEKTREFYNDLKIFNKLNFDNLFFCALGLLREECKCESEKLQIQKFESDIQQIRIDEEKKMRRKIAKSDNKKKEKRNGREEKEQRRQKRIEEEYGKYEL